MNQILIFILGAVAVGIIVKLLDSRLPASPAGRRVNYKEGGGDDKKGESKESLIEKQAEEKRQNKEAILGILETRHPLTNNHVEQLLGISDATATRYLEELEKEGKIRQVGKTGKHVYYERRNVV